MEPQRRRINFLRLASPFILYFAVSMVVELMTSMYITIVNMDETMRLLETNGNLMEIMMGQVDTMMKYVVEMSILKALCLVPVMLFLFLKDRHEEKKAGIIPMTKTGALSYLLIPVLGVALCIALNVILILFNAASYSITYQQVTNDFYAARFSVQLIGLGLITPIAEEYMFRGVLYNRLKELVTPKRAMWFSALMFGMYHTNMVQFIYGLAFGFVLAYIYEKCGSIAAPILLHIVANLTSLLMTKYGGFVGILQNVGSAVICTGICVAVSVGTLMAIHSQREKLLKEVE